MQTEIEKRIEEELDSIWNRDRKDIEYKFKNFDTGFQAGAKFILELPELREAVETLSKYASENNWAYGRSKNLGKYIPINGMALPNGFNKAQEALSKIKALGIVKE